jgi:hypothetical protein
MRGKIIEENEKQGEFEGARVASWLRYFRSHAPAKSQRK